MQEIKIHCLANGVVGAYRDYLNASSASAPTIVKGVEVLFSIRLFARPNSPEPYNIELLRNVVSWKFAMDKDFDEATTYILEADNAGITLNAIEEEGQTYTEINIPLPETNTVELNEWMGTSKSKTGLVAELSGYDAESKAVFVLQLENFTVRNRLGSSGSPENLSPDYLTEAQVRALVKTEAAASAPKINADGDWEVAGVDTNVKASGTPAGFGEITAVAQTLSNGSEATAEAETSGPDSAKKIIFRLGIPVGEKGKDGAPGQDLRIDMVAPLSDKAFYDEEPKYFAFLSEDGDLYIKLSDASGDWSEPVKIAPKRGVDYWTEQDQEAIKDEMLNEGW